MQTGQHLTTDDRNLVAQLSGHPVLATWCACDSHTVQWETTSFIRQIIHSSTVDEYLLSMVDSQQSRVINNSVLWCCWLGKDVSTVCNDAITNTCSQWQLHSDACD